MNDLEMFDFSGTIYDCICDFWEVYDLDTKQGKCSLSLEINKGIREFCLPEILNKIIHDLNQLYYEVNKDDQDGCPISVHLDSITNLINEYNEKLKRLKREEEDHD